MAEKSNTVTSNVIERFITVITITTNTKFGVNMAKHCGDTASSQCGIMPLTSLMWYTKTVLYIYRKYITFCQHGLKII